MRQWKKVVIVLFLLLSFVVVAVLGPWIFLFVGLLLVPAPPGPEITYGEFPFTLTYEINGEEREIRDIVICEFDGFKNRGTAGKARQWKTYIKSTGNEYLTVLDFHNLNIKGDYEETILDIYFDYGTGSYYMGDTEDYYARSGQNFDRIYFHYQTAEGKTGGSGYSDEYAYEKFKIKLINWEIEPPIENKFNRLSPYQKIFGLFGVEM